VGPLLQLVGLPEKGTTKRPGSSGEIRYRADIDGLRAVAVLLVIFFHMGLRPAPAVLSWIASHVSRTLAARIALGVPGGFVGVDIFFVISGFLIGGILLREQATGTFSIVRFYERRVRRILPALLAVLLFTLIAGYAALLPYEFRELGVSVIAAIFSASNFFFLRHSGYFEPTALSKPLLHTWSLAVEEQFYLVFPLLLLALHRTRKIMMRLSIALLALCSFAFSAYQVHARPDAAFYLPLARGWELLLGVLVAMQIVPAPRAQRLRDAASIAGLGLIAAAALLLTTATPFPGPSALLPCGGAALIIYAGINGPSLAGRWLSLKPVVFVGLISYSLYLWHWPLLLANKYEYFSFLRLNSWWLFLLMLGVSVLSWRFVEQPFRAGRFRPGRKLLFVGAAVAVSLVSAVGLWAYRSNGVPQRFPAALLEIAAYPERGSKDPQWDNGCFIYGDHSRLNAGCLEPKAGVSHLLLLGDSHAAHLRDGLSAALPAIQIEEAAAANCTPLLSSLQSKDALCRGLTQRIFQSFLRENHPDVVLLSGFWQTRDLASLGETIDQLHREGQRVYVFGPSPAYDQPLPILLINASHRHDASLPMRHLDPSAPQFAAFDAEMEKVAQVHGAERYISLRRLLCKDGACMEYVRPGVPVEFDASHFTAAGSEWVAAQLRETHQLP
jgi:peptidoglycan/LPS O-acetylase OafA/YrhL